MSRADKLRAMEALWADLSRDEAAIDSPGWHGAVLRETEELVRDGKAKFSDWRTARHRIRRKAGRRDGKHNLLLTPKPVRRRGAIGLLKVLSRCPAPMPAPERHALPVK
jgi:hypothetical protein